MFRIHMGGKSLKFANFPKKDQAKIRERLQKKYPDTIKKASRKPSILIDGKPATQEYVDSIDLLKHPGRKVIKPKPKEPIKPTAKKYTRSEVWAMSKAEQVSLLKELKVKRIPGLEKRRVDLIMRLQEE